MPKRSKKLSFVPSPPGMRVPHGGSSCHKCMYVSADGTTCENEGYVGASYPGKRRGDDRFIDGKTGDVVADPRDFCCNFFDW